MINFDNYCQTEDGIAEILEEIQFYYEEFDKDKDVDSMFNDFKLGEKDRVIYICKCFCNFKGKPINRLNVRIYTNIRKLRKIDKKVFENYLNLNPKHFEKIQQKRNDVLRQVFLSYLLENKTYEKLRQVYPLLRNELISKDYFEWKEFVEVSSRYIPEFDTDSFLRTRRAFRKTEENTEITIRFDSTNYKVRDGKSLFDNIVIFEDGDNFHAIPTE